MARIVVGSYMIRYPLGGMMSYVLQYLVGFRELGHEVYFVEKSGYPNSCYDPSRNVMSDDCTYGTRAAARLLSRFGLERNWCFVDADGEYHGIGSAQMKNIFRSADLFLDMGTHGAWMDETIGGCRVLLDGEPGYTQINLTQKLALGISVPEYDLYYTAGANIGSEESSTPVAGKQWRHLPHPVVTRLFDWSMPPHDSPFTTIMNWQSHDPIEFEGSTYGQKDVEFAKFVSIPQTTCYRLEVAISGKHVPTAELEQAGWILRDAHAVTSTYDCFLGYIRESAGELSVCKNVFVALRTGWFSDRSAAYLASGRPVILQDTGFGKYLPCGEGLFAFGTHADVTAALESVNSDYKRHSTRAREIALEYLEARKVLGGMLAQLGIQ